jgi:hypothetical protein
VPQRGGVEQDAVVARPRFLDDARDAVEQGRFLRSGGDAGDLYLAVHLGREARRHSVGDARLDVADVAVGLACRIDLHRPEPRQDLTRVGPDVRFQNVVGRVRRIGGHQERALAALRS